MRASDLLGHLPLDSGFLRDRLPTDDYVADFGEDALGPAARQAGNGGYGAQVGDAEPVALAVERHLVGVEPEIAGLPRPDHVVRRGQRPGSLAVHEEGDVLDVVVLIARDDVEDHPPELLLDDGLAEAQPTDQQHELLVAVGTGLVVADVLQRGDRLHVQLAAAVGPVETTGHEMPATVLLQEPALGHVDAGRAGHLRVRVLDRAPALGVGEPVVAGALDPVELQQPMPKALADLDLTRADLAGGVVVCDERLRSRPAGGAADSENRLHGLLVGVLAELGHELLTLREHLAGEAHERRDLEVRAIALVSGLVGGLELQRADAARSYVAEPLNDVEAGRLTPLRSQPGVDERRAPAVG